MGCHTNSVIYFAYSYLQSLELLMDRKRNSYSPFCLLFYLNNYQLVYVKMVKRRNSDIRKLKFGSTCLLTKSWMSSDEQQVETGKGNLDINSWFIRQA